jgi:hypothetical protein
MAEAEERNGTDSRNGTINDDGSSNILIAVIERRGKLPCSTAVSESMQKNS